MLIVGLGNPGKEYESTRHNVGFMAVDELRNYFNFSEERSKYKGLFSEGLVGNQKIYTLKPTTFMNKSGISVAQCVSFYKIPLDKIWVIYDELDISVGKLKVKQGGGSGGHNGIKSLDAHIGQDYHRVRVGIDHPGDSRKVSSYVLHKFKTEELTVIEKQLQIMAKNLPILLQEGREDFLTKVALDMR